MAEMKTKETKASVTEFLKSITDPQRREDAMAVTAMMEAATKTKPKMWGANLVGFGTQHYRYDSGREGDWFRTGFAPRKDRLTLYLTSGLARHPHLMEKLGKYTMGSACLHIRKLADVDRKVLKQLIAESLKHPLPGAEP
jgi:hypothetical protein